MKEWTLTGEELLAYANAEWCKKPLGWYDGVSWRSGWINGYMSAWLDNYEPKSFREDSEIDWIW